jgi:hypothetical protein
MPAGGIILKRRPPDTEKREEPGQPGPLAFFLGSKLMIDPALATVKHPMPFNVWAFTSIK